MSLNIKVLPAMHGDSILINWDEGKGGRNILIDGGIGRTYYQYLSKIIQEIKKKGEQIDLLVITHIDEDHIEGICKMFEDDEFDDKIIKKVWFNSGEVISSYFGENLDEARGISLSDSTNKKKSVKQGIILEDRLKNLGFANTYPVMKGLLEEIGKMKIRVLSPNIKGLENLNKKWEVEIDKNKKKASKIDHKNTIEELLENEEKEHTSIPNASSIGILLEYKEKNYLMLGDCKAAVIEDSLSELGYNLKNKIKVNLVKVAHHGSKKNTTKSLLDIIECSNFVISTNSEKYGLPDKECLAKIIDKEKNVKFYFNYDYVDDKKIFSEEEYKNHKFTCNVLKSESKVEIDGGVFLWR